MKPKWNEQEIQILKNDYKDCSKEKLIELLPNRTWMAIKVRAFILQVTGAQGGRNRKQINKYFFDKWSNEMAYVLGFFAADGNMHRYGKYSYIIAFIQKEKEILLKIAKLMNWNVVLHLDKESKSFSIMTSNKHIYNQLLKLGMTPRKSLTIKFPKIPKKYARHFIRGVFDGNGGISLYGKYKISNCNFASGSLLFLKKLKIVLLNKGIKGSKIYKQKIYYTRFNKEPMIKLFHYMYDDVPKSMYIERKYNKFVEWFNTRKIKYKK